MNEWISVKQELPPLGKAVLVWDTYGAAKTKGSIKQVTRNKNSQKNFWNNEWKGVYMGSSRYSHWMPLPNPPDVEAEETRPLESRLPGNTHANTGEYLVKLV